MNAFDESQPTVGPVVVRTPSFDEAHVLAGVLRRSWAQTYRGLLPESALLIGEEEATASWESQITATTAGDSLSRLFVGDINGQVVGWVSYGPLRDHEKESAPNPGELPAADQGGVSAHNHAPAEADAGSSTTPGDTITAGDAPTTGDATTAVDAARVMELYSWYTDPALWGAGVGHVLLGHAMRHGRVLGFDEARAWVVEGNDRAVEAYRRHGWEPTGARRVVAVRGVDVAEVELTVPL